MDEPPVEASRPATRAETRHADEPRADEVVDRPLRLDDGRWVGRVLGIVRRADDLPAYLDIEVTDVLVAHRTLVPLRLTWCDADGAVRVRRLSRRHLRRLPRYLGERATLSAELEARIARAIGRVATLP